MSTPPTCPHCNKPQREPTPFCTTCGQNIELGGRPKPAAPIAGAIAIVVGTAVFLLVAQPGEVGRGTTVSWGSSKEDKRDKTSPTSARGSASPTRSKHRAQRSPTPAPTQRGPEIAFEYTFEGTDNSITRWRIKVRATHTGVVIQAQQSNQVVAWTACKLIGAGDMHSGPGNEQLFSCPEHEVFAVRGADGQLLAATRIDTSGEDIEAWANVTFADLTNDRTAEAVLTGWREISPTMGSGSACLVLGFDGESLSSLYYDDSMVELIEKDSGGEQAEHSWSVRPARGGQPTRLIHTRAPATGRKITKVVRFDTLKTKTNVLKPSAPAQIAAISASSTLDNSKRYKYDAELALDGDPKTSWCEGKRRDGVGERLTIRLSKPVAILRVEMALGFWHSRKYYKLNNVPTKARVTLNGGHKRTVNSRGYRRWSSAKFGGTIAKTVSVQLLAVKRGKRRQWRDTCITDVRVITAGGVLKLRH